MLLPRDEALRFIEGYKSVLLKALDLVGIEHTSSIISDLAKARKEILSHSSLLERSISELSTIGKSIDSDVLLAIRSINVSQWVFLRHTKTAAIFLDKEVQSAFAVKALTTPMNQVVDAVPSMFTAGVFRHMGHFVCDGIIENPVILGPGYKAQFNAAYSIIRKSGHYYAKPDEVGKPIA